MVCYLITIYQIFRTNTIPGIKRSPVVIRKNKTITSKSKKIVMGKVKTVVAITCVLLLLFFNVKMSGNSDDQGGTVTDQSTSKTDQTKTTQTTTKTDQTKPKTTQTTTKPVQTKPKTTQTTTKPVQAKPKTTQTKPKPVQAKPKTTQSKPKPIPDSTTPVTDTKPKDAGTVKIGTQIWATANLNVSTFRNGDTIPEAKTNIQWAAAGAAGRPVWCYYNNNSAYGPKYGKLYNWFAVNDIRELAPVGWTLSSEADWTVLTNYLGGQGVAGRKMKSTLGWNEGNNGTDETGFMGLPGGYRVENGTFLNLGSIGTWWSVTEAKTLTAIDHYLSMSAGLGKGSNPKSRGESVRCIKK